MPTGGKEVELGAGGYNARNIDRKAESRQIAVVLRLAEEEGGRFVVGRHLRAHVGVGGRRILSRQVGGVDQDAEIRAQFLVRFFLIDCVDALPSARRRYVGGEVATG